MKSFSFLFEIKEIYIWPSALLVFPYSSPRRPSAQALGDVTLVSATHGPWLQHLTHVSHSPAETHLPPVPCPAHRNCRLSVPMNFTCLRRKGLTARKQQPIIPENPSGRVCILRRCLSVQRNPLLVLFRPYGEKAAQYRGGSAEGRGGEEEDWWRGRQPCLAAPLCVLLAQASLPQFSATGLLKALDFHCTCRC